MCISKASCLFRCLVVFSLQVSWLWRDGSSLLELLWGEAHNKANNSVSIMITAFLRAVHSISFTLEWLYLDLVMLCVFLFCFLMFFCPELRKVQHNYLRLSKQLRGILNVYSSEITRSDDIVSAEKVTGSRVVPGIEIKPKGCCLNPCMPTEWKTWPCAHLLSITSTES